MPLTMNYSQWHNPEAYAYTQTLNLSEWAWQFLRRNPNYQTDWKWFWPLWQSLEHDTHQARLLRDRDYSTILKYLDNDQDK